MDTSGLKTVGIAFVVILVLAGIFSGAAYWKYRLVLRDDPPVTVSLEPVFVPGSDGTQVLNATFRVPWNKEPEGVLFVWAEGVTPVSEPQILFKGYGWGADQWTTRVEVRPGAECLGSAGVMGASFSDGSRFVFRLPPLHAIADGELGTKDISDTFSGKVLAVIGLAAGLLIIVLVVFTILDLFRKRRV